MKKNYFFTLLLSVSIFNAQVGVNTSTPQKTLHVNGSLQITNELVVGGNASIAGNTGTNGQVLVSTGANSAPKWETINNSSANTFGDLKYSFLTDDHNGWINLNGRNVSSLTSSQQAQASSLGFTTTIPNATGAYFVQNGNTIGGLSNSNTKTIIRAELPDFTLTAAGIAGSAGAHTHSYTDRGNTSFTSGSGSSPIADDTNGSYTTSSSGTHTHIVTAITTSINGGVTQKPIDIRPLSLSANAFMYLGF
jgi:hypothetical protein